MPDSKTISIEVPAAFVDQLNSEERTHLAAGLTNLEGLVEWQVGQWIREELEEHPEDREWISFQAKAILTHPTDPAAGRFRFIPELLSDMGDRPDPPTD